MGSRGPAPKPTALRLLHGDQKSRINTEEPVPAAAGCPEPPEWLTEEAAAMWRRLAPDLHAKRVLTLWDVDAFAVVVSAYTTWKVAQQVVDAEGILVPGERGQVKHPAAQIARDQWGVFSQAAGRFGLTPSDRAQLRTGGGRDPGDDLLT